MGLEGFNLRLTSGPAIGEVERAVRPAGGVRIDKTDAPRWRHWEIGASDYIIEIQVEAREQKRSRGSLRSALCCNASVVKAMVALAKVISECEQSATWNVFGEDEHVDVCSDQAEDELLKVFVRRRNDLLRVFGLESIPCAAKRADEECLEYARRQKRSAAAPGEGD